MEFQGILWGHVATGSVAVIAGLTALLVKKGSILHRKAGKGFVLTMLLMALSGIALAIIKPMAISVLAGALTTYLVLSSLWSVKDAPNTLSHRQYLNPVASATISFSGAYLVWQAWQAGQNQIDGFSLDAYLFFAVIALVCCLLDIRLLVKKGLNPAQRLARHLWRMGFALFIAVGSFIGQGAGILPQALQESAWLELPDKIILLVIVLWLLKLFVQPRT
ncbi:DUF2306 domain-containing protein [Bowmanella dokdonensis]|uniref:DUF2306 domain-containing protein n=1 Tax=Bowmanella dokdonensis TaxID=751969 RepID=A0A939DPC1_9ALTE|nr:DUF2306 domain-containing protein [Bowmanella dokdonensis]MBN7825486.1 hypothetical protein [Bowmanella dokdonensis]